ncbi:response regulator transcription factor [Amaricoccus solimangrovi]|uniref:Response regulator transcription factor n=1 Tax=Amaricoccus solimangrovi TaxID=2589815 RepID=A0A501WY61_9RHOB|nr:response regulator transcription factor [Amaricoccus solimangrovi]TPE52457.1 response regulator transcription factor [Amaricoccus solimangrovi]
MRVLLLEDALDVAEAVEASFSRRGDAVDHAARVADALELIAVQDYDVAILDVGLPDGSGTDVLAALRAAASPTFVLMLTARSKVDDRVSALDEGADDYLVKPFDLRELHARVRALTRRAGESRAALIEFGDIVFDPAQCALSVQGVPVTLTRREFSLLEIMLANRGRVIPKERILDRMFSFNEEEVGVNAVETYVARLRRKLEGSSVSIRTLRGLGYQLVAER